MPDHVWKVYRDVNTIMEILNKKYILEAEDIDTYVELSRSLVYFLINKLRRYKLLKKVQT